MNHAIIVVLSGLLLISVGCAGAAPKETRVNSALILNNTRLYGEPGAETAEAAKVSRGEAVTVRQEKGSGDDAWLEIVLSDDETSGWIKKRYVHLGPKDPISLTEKTALYVRPDEQSKPLKTLQRGTAMFILKDKGEWKKVSVEYQLEGWIKTDKFERGIINKEE